MMSSAPPFCKGFLSFFLLHEYSRVCPPLLLHNPGYDGWYMATNKGYTRARHTQTRARTDITLGLIWQDELLSLEYRSVHL